MVQVVSCHSPSHFPWPILIYQIIRSEAPMAVNIEDRNDNNRNMIKET